MTSSQSKSEDIGKAAQPDMYQEHYQYKHNTTTDDYKIKEYPRKKYVHMMSHSHDDLGWLNPIGDYYSGSSNIFYYGSINDVLTTTT